MRNKRGQVSVFIILGLVALLLFCLFVVFERSQIRQGVEERKSSETLPLEFMPVKSLVEGCILNLAEEAVKKLGQQGGYINVSEGMFITSDPTSSDALVFAPGSKLVLPYWWYLKSPNTCPGGCIFSSNMPRLKSHALKGERPYTDTSIEAQIDRYINNHLEACLDFEQLERQGLHVQVMGEPVTTTSIGDDVEVRVDYPLLVSKGAVKADIQGFSSTIDLDLRRIYNAAASLAVSEANYWFLEYNTLNLISGFSDISPDKLPPTNAVRLGASPVYWVVADVKNRITGMLTSYIPLIQVYGARNYRKRVLPDIIEQAAYDNMVVALNSSDQFRALDVGFIYLAWWRPYFDMNTASLLKGESLGTILPLPITVQRYRFSYDLSYPVVVIINDPSALNNRGYTFQFAMEANIRGNQPLNNSMGIIEYEESLFCNLGNLNVTIIVKSPDGKPLSGVAVSYICADQECLIGETTTEGLRAALPRCINGLLLLSKEGYLPRMRAVEPDDSEISILISPLQEKRLVVQKKLLKKAASRWEFGNQAFELRPDETAIVAITRVGSAGEGGYSTAAEYRPGQESSIRLAPGLYTVSIHTMINRKYVIPKRNEQRCTAFLICNDYTIPEVELDQLPSGGVELSNKTAFWIVQADQLANADEIVFYTVSPDLISIPEAERSVSDLNKIGEVEYYSKAYRTLLEPELNS